MSLLLEALKKAELAKQNAKGDVPAAEKQPEPPAEPAAPLMTRERLPDISQPLEILSDDLPSSPERRPPSEAPQSALSLEADTGVRAPEPPAMEDPERIAGRAQAQRIFQAKEMDYNPKRPFYLTLGALAVVGLGYAGYVWWQLQPKSSVGIQASSAAASRASAAPAQTAAAPTPPPQAAGTVPPVATSKPVIPPISPVRPTRPLASTRGPTAAAPAQRLGPAVTPAQVAPARPGELAPIAINPPTLIVDPLLDQAYQAFQRNDLVAARDGYLRAAARDPNNRDVLLGLAAIDLRNGDFETAESRYVKLLEMNPRDSHAIAALTALRSQVDPVVSESRLKNMIAGQPEAAHLHFALANQYARQSRWTEAQAAYFKAYSADPENPDYAFNLAVSLDQLRQGDPALEYYRRALDLASRHPANFNRAQAETRIQELSR